MRADTADLVSVTYTSTATRLLSVAQLVELIEQIRSKNERLGVTGLLLYSGGNVIQTLEGTPDAVDAVFGSIAGDPRHGDVHVVDRRAIDERSFATWSMGFRNVSAPRGQPSCRTSATSPASPSGTTSPHMPPSAFGLLARFRVTHVETVAGLDDVHALRGLNA